VIDAGVAVSLLVFAAAGFAVALWGAFSVGRQSEENRGKKYLRSLSHLYNPSKDKTVDWSP